MKKLFYLNLFLIFFTFSCEESNNIDESNLFSTNKIETLFRDSTYTSEVDYELLKELNICDTLNQSNDCIESFDVTTCSPCTPKYFKIYPYNNSKDLKDAFMLQIKALTILKGQNKKLPMRHLIVFERENGYLVKVNAFRGNLIETRENKKGIKDLVIRFYIPEEEAFMNCLFQWNNGKYNFNSVESIDGAGGRGKVKRSMKEEISKDIYQLLMKNQFIF